MRMLFRAGMSTLLLCLFTASWVMSQGSSANNSSTAESSSCAGFGCAEAFLPGCSVNMNVNCDVVIEGVTVIGQNPGENPEVQNDLRRAVVIITIGESSCTATLINSYSSNCSDTAPRYFLITAGHCIKFFLDAGGSLDTLEITFGWESNEMDCEDGEESDINTITKTGAILRWWSKGFSFNTCGGPDDDPVDVALLEMIEAPPADVFYAGWERITTLPTASVGIHHVFGDIKKINVDIDSPTLCGSNMIQVGSAVPDDGWEVGFGSGGSSGSSLFSLDSYKLIGVSFAKIPGEGDVLCSGQGAFYQTLNAHWENQSGDGNIQDPTWTADLNFPCCVGTVGNVDNDPNDIVDIADYTFLIDHLFINFPPLACPAEGNIDGDPNCTVDIADLTALMDYLFLNPNPMLPSCSAFDERACNTPTLSDLLAPGFPTAMSIEGFDPIESTYTPCL